MKKDDKDDCEGILCDVMQKVECSFKKMLKMCHLLGLLQFPPPVVCTTKKSDEIKPFPVDLSKFSLSDLFE